MISLPNCSNCLHFELTARDAGHCDKHDKWLTPEQSVVRLMAAGLCFDFDPNHRRVEALKAGKRLMKTVADAAVLMRMPLPEEVTSRGLLLEGTVAALLTVGLRTFEDLPAVLNLAVLARSTLREPHLRVHQISSAAVATIAQTDLHTMPREPLALLDSPFLIESRNTASETLFGETYSLGGYWHERQLYLVGMSQSGGSYVAPWRPEWNGKAIDKSAFCEDCMGTEGLVEWAKEAARFVVILAALLEAHQSPITTRDESPSLPGKRKKGRRVQARPWSTRYVNLTGHEPRSAGPGGPVGPRGAGSLSHSVMVKGHLKRQRYGEGHSKEKWIYVESYEARRWFVTKPVGVKVRVT